MIGVNFQPGSNSNGQNGNGNGSAPQGSGVQEAIKVLSLRLPKVVGAQAAVPMPLLTSQGSGGNPRVDSIVNQILSRLPQGQQPSFGGPQQQAPAPSGAPSFGGAAQPSYQPQPQAPWSPPPGFNPRVVISPPGTIGDVMQGPDGRPMGGSFPGAVEAPPQMPAVDWDRLGRLLGGQQQQAPSPAGAYDTPLF